MKTKFVVCSQSAGDDDTLYFTGIEKGIPRWDNPEGMNGTDNVVFFNTEKDALVVCEKIQQYDKLHNLDALVFVLDVYA